MATLEEHRLDLFDPAHLHRIIALAAMTDSRIPRPYDETSGRQPWSSNVYEMCPKCGFKPRDTDTVMDAECASCGVIFAKWEMLQEAIAANIAPSPEQATAPTGLLRRLFEVPPHTNHAVFFGHVILYIGLVIWGTLFILTDFRKVDAGFPETSSSFMHRVNLVFHEAGHIIFLPLGEFMTTLGGSLGQLLMPAIVLGVFLFQERNTFGASVGLWWLGQSMIDLAPYINDARGGQLVLLGGVTGQDAPGYHDWTSLLSQLGWMQHDHAIAGSVDFLGETFMWLAFAWGGTILFRQFQRLNNRL